MPQVFYVACASFICLYAVLSYTLGLKVALLIFGAAHFGCALLLLVWCWSDIWDTAPVEKEGRLRSSDLYS
jgi:hypothetical protein